MVGTHRQKVLLAVACCFVLILLPLSTGWAQKSVLDDAKTGIEKGAHEVKKGAETVGEKTKEGAEAIGKGAKDLVTDDDKNTRKSETSTDRMKPTGQSGATGTTSPGRTSSGTTGSTSTSTENAGTGEHKLPATAGELPLLALVGAIALASAEALRLVRKTP